MQTERQIRGALGEEAAVNYLRQNGFMIAERNYRVGQDEVDIIAMRYDEIHFVEVKTRKFGSLTAPEQAINGRKLRAMRRAASAYLAQHRCDLEPTFSLIAIEVVGEAVESLRFVENALEYGW